MTISSVLYHILYIEIRLLKHERHLLFLFLTYDTPIVSNISSDECACAVDNCSIPCLMEYIYIYLQTPSVLNLLLFYFFFSEKGPRVE